MCCGICGLASGSLTLSSEQAVAELTTFMREHGLEVCQFLAAGVLLVFAMCVCVCAVVRCAVETATDI
eukprot:3423806-Rhodomonas_salina.1